MLAVDAFGAYGVSQMQIEYDVLWYMGPDSYNLAFLTELRDQFPKNGERVQMYLLGEIDYWNRHEEVMKAYEILKSDDRVVGDSVNFWYPVFHADQCKSGLFDCSTGTFDKKSTHPIASPTHTHFPEIGFKRALLTFLQQNIRYSPDIKFNVSLTETDQTQLLQGGFEITVSTVKPLSCLYLEFLGP